MTLFARNVTMPLIPGSASDADAPIVNPTASVESLPSAATSTKPNLSLQSLLAADMSLAWDESVSIVEALCEAVQGDVPRAIPGSSDVFLTDSGQVMVRSGAGTPEPVEAARHLVELLGKGTVPAPLRLFASQAVRAEQHASLEQFRQGLEYFSKPGGRERLIAVFERAARELAAKPLPTAAQTNAAVQAQMRESGNVRARWGRKVLIAGGTFVATVLVVSAGYFAWVELSRPPVVLTAAPDVPVKAAPPARRQATRPQARTDSAAIGAQPQFESRDAGAGTSIGSSGSARVSGPSELEIAERDSATAPPSTIGDAPVGGSVPAAAPSAGAGPASELEQMPGPVMEERVYSSTETGVVPATLVRQQLMSPAIGSPTGQTPLQIELFVSAEGTVERARFLVPPRRMTDMMLLSNAKTWTFNPALKDGRPVRSRLVLPWVVAP